jgi:N-methylhydantoinase A
MTSWRLGVDSGGTFTDVCLVREDTGELQIAKLPSTPHDPSEAILAGVGEMLRGRPSADQVRFFGHGTTVATNALIERNGARTAVVTTAGFRDLLEIGRQRRPHLYDLQRDKPVPLVPRDLRFELEERVYVDGQAPVRPEAAEVDGLAARLAELEVEALSICFLHSFVSPEHEQLVRDRLREALPDVFITASHDVSAEFREYERLSTTVVNSFVGPMMRGYLRRLRTGLAEAGLECAPQITLSNGGVVSFDSAEATPMRTVLSGPSTGLVGAADVAGRSGYGDLITFDMGGTSTDVALIRDGVPTMRSDLELQGHAIRTPMLDIETIGAGGGSIAWVDSGGHLRVGPQSAGASPGPACYGNGGERPTVTDANAALGILGGDRALAGRVELDVEAAGRVVAVLGEELGLDVRETAEGILRVVTANMARAIRVISAAKGHDPRDYALVAFGGAGPLHAARLAEEMGIPRVLVPETPGVLCAQGLLVANVRTDYALTRIVAAREGRLEEIAAAFAPLEARAESWLEEEGIPLERRSISRSADMRYRGQNYELRVPLPAPPSEAAALRRLVADFGEVHERTYGYRLDDEEVQLVTLRVAATGLTPAVEAIPTEAGDGDPARALIERRDLLLAGGGECEVFDRDRLLPGDVIEGPAVIEQMDTTTFVPAGASGTVDAHRALLMELPR